MPAGRFRPIPSEIEIGLREQGVQQGGELREVFERPPGEIFFNVFQIVVFRVHQHADEVGFAVSGVIGDLPVGRLHIEVLDAE